MRLFCSKNETCPLLEHLAWFLPNFQGCDQFLHGLLRPCDIQWSPKHLSKICFWTFVSPGNDQGRSLEAAGPLQPWEEKDKGAFVILIPDGREVELGIQALPSHSQPQGKRVKIEIQEIPFNVTKSSLLWERLNPGIHFPERLWALHPWGFSKLPWMWAWAACPSWALDGAFPEEDLDSTSNPQLVCGSEI